MKGKAWTPSSEDLRQLGEHLFYEVEMQRYIHLAGVVFRDEAERAEARIFGELEAPETG